jgi:hypothetical protein
MGDTRYDWRARGANMAQTIARESTQQTHAQGICAQLRMRAQVFAPWLLASALTFALFAWAFTRPARLFDGDSYYHLAAARLLAQHGFVAALPWARFSVLGEHYGDKELLFHLLLVPFVSAGGDLEQNGQLALACLCSALALTLAYLGSRALGRIGLGAAALVFLGSGSFLLRALRLRPELLALLLLLWLVWALAHERYLRALVLAVAFALAHTAFHSLLGLSLAWFVWLRVVEGRWHWRLPLCVWAGVLLGLAVHPRFPDNLTVFWLQNVEFFRHRAELDVGGEFQPYTTWNLFCLDGPWWLGLLTLICARSRRLQDCALAQRRMAGFCWIAGLSFAALFIQMGRFASSAMPFLSLALLFELAAQNYEICPRLALPGGRSLATAPVLALLLLLATLDASATAYANWHLSGSFDRGLSAELRQLAGRLPPGARVAATWADAEQYAFFAPEARYLNVLDPVFMAMARPAQHALWTRIVAGAEPDVPAALALGLDSDYLAFSAAGHTALAARLSSDPRLELLQHGRHFLFQVRPGRDRGFMQGWTPRASAAPLNDLSASGLAGYVDASSALAADGCAVLRHEQSLDAPSTRLFELASWGPSTLFVDGEQRVQLAAPGLAKLGEGVAFPLRLAAGDHRLVVRTCAHEGRAGFYLLDRGGM